MEIQLSDVGHIIQLSVAPVFLLTGVGTTLTVLTNRLARIVDRSRRVEDRVRDHGGMNNEEEDQELETLFVRAHLINRAIMLCTATALMVSTVIAALFIGDALSISISQFIAVFFVAAMLSLVSAYIYLLREILIATNTLARRRVIKIQK